MNEVERSLFLFCLELVLDESIDLHLLQLHALEVLDDLAQVVLALADLDAHVQRLALLLLGHDALGDLFRLRVQELLAVGDVPQQFLLHLQVVALLALPLQLAQLAHALVPQQLPQRHHAQRALALPARLRVLALLVRPAQGGEGLRGGVAVEVGLGQVGHHDAIHFYKHILSRNNHCSFLKICSLGGGREEGGKMNGVNQTGTFSAEALVKMLAGTGSGQQNQCAFLGMVDKLRPIILDKIRKRERSAKKKREIRFDDVISVKRFVSNDLVSNLHKDIDRYEGLNTIYQQQLRRGKQLKAKPTRQTK